MTNYVECVPNFSEGRRPEVVAAIRDAIAATNGVTVLDVSSDASHNRSVITFVAPVEFAVEASFAAIRKSLELIDLNEHTGEHPRIGATDVMPFVPLGPTTMEQCIALARELGARVGRELAIPVYLYERAATRPERVNLAHVRRGNFEGLRDVLGREPEREPDFGPNHIHPTFGAIAIGARPVLVAYNIYLGGAANLPLAKRIASGIRESSGGLPAVKAMGLNVDHQAQVSMNLVDIDRTPLHVVFDAVSQRAADEGVKVTWSEIIGLVPERALNGAAASWLKLDNFSESQILERRVLDAQQQEPTVRGFLASIASSDPDPGGGTASAHAGAVAASLVRMVAGLTIGKKKYAQVEAEMHSVAKESEALAQRLHELGDEDAGAYAAVSAAYKMAREPEGAAAARVRAVDAALTGAALVPLETARLCARVAELAAATAQRGNSNAASDSAVAALLADAACRGAVYNVRINVSALSNPEVGSALVEQTNALLAVAGRSASVAREVVERAAGATK